MADRQLFFLTTAAIIIGIIFTYSLSTYATLYFEYGQFSFFLKQFIAGVLSIGVMWMLSRSDPDSSRMFGVIWWGFVLFIAALFLMGIMHFLPESIARSIGGAKRWIRLPGFSIAPVEFFKVGFVMFLAWSFSRKFNLSRRPTFLEESKLFAPYIFLFFVIVYLVAVMQNDLGQVIILGATLMIMAMFAGGSMRLFILLMLGALSVFVLAIIGSAHRIERVKQWWATSQNFILSLMPEGIAASLRVEDLPEPYQVNQSFNAIYNGGFFGEGLGNGVIKLGFLSEIHTDIVLAGIAEEIGFIGLLAVSLLLLFIIYRIFRIASRSKNMVHHLFCVGVGMLIACSFIINAFGISGITPIKGIAVPFISYGGSSLLAHSIAIGLVLSISKKSV